MKERIVIKDEFWVKHFQEREKDFYEEDMCSGGNPEEWWHYEKEQVPETWEELKELCKGLENVSIHDVGGYIKLSINGNLIYFFIAGEMEGKIDITNNTFLERFCVIQKATPSQMWQIIKSLIGEEKWK